MLFGNGVIFALTAHFCGLVKDYGLPKFSREWWGRCIGDENLMSIFFCILYLVYSHTAFWLIPEGIMGAIVCAKLA
jgi:hypothetical protein